MNHHPLDPLLNRRVRAGVGDPWFFESLSGPNLIEGIVEAVPPHDDPVAWLLCSVHPFWHDQTKIEQVLVTAMHGDHCPLSMLLYGRRVPVHMVFDATGEHLAAPREVISFLSDPSTRTLMGLFELVRTQPSSRPL